MSMPMHAEAATATTFDPLHPPESDLWLARAHHHYDTDRRLSYAGRAVGLWLANHLSANEARRWAGRWGRFDD